MPSIEVTGLRVCSLKWEASLALMDWIADLELEVRSRLSTCISTMMHNITMLVDID